MVTATASKALPLAVQGMRDRIGQMAADLQIVLRDNWPDDLPSLLDPDLTVDHLDRIRQLVTNVENPPPPAPPAEVSPERVAELRAAVNSLPEDLVAQLSSAATAAGVPPQMVGATVEHEQTVANLLEAMAKEQAARRTRIHGRMAGFDNDETIRHALISFATGGRVESSNQVTADEVELVERAADMLELGDLQLVIDEAGTRVADPDGKWAATLGPADVDWKTVAKEHDTTQAALIRQARRLAIEAGEEAPAKLQQLTAAQVARLLASHEPSAADHAPHVDVTPPEKPVTPEPAAEPPAAAHQVAEASASASTVLVVLVRPGGLQQHLVDDAVAAQILQLVGAA